MAWGGTMYYCAKCGTQVPDGMAFCTNCGTPVRGGQAAPPQPAAAAPPAAPAAHPGYAPAPYAMAAPASSDGMSSSSAVGLVFFVLGVIAALVGTGLAWEDSYAWAAGVFVVAAFLFLIGGVFFNQGKRQATAAVPPYGAWPPQMPPSQPPQPPGPPPR